MKKMYITPKSNSIILYAETEFLTISGVKSGGEVGNEFDSSDVSYTNRQEVGTSLWDNW